MKTTNKVIKLAAAGCGTLLAFTSCQTREDALESLKTSQTSSYTSSVESALTSEISGQIECAEESVQSVEEKPVHYKYTEFEIDMLARLVYAEAGCCSADEQRLIVWTVFQRVDSADYDFRNMNTIESVVTAPNQFAYFQNSPIIESIREICAEEISKWANFENPPTLEPYAPTLPYYFYEGDGYHNWFRAEW